MIATLAYRLQKVPRVGSFDDFGFIAPLPLTEDALPISTELNDIFGLGLMVDLPPRPTGPPRLSPSVANRGKLLARIEEVIRRGGEFLR